MDILTEENLSIFERYDLIKGILFDWHGVLIEDAIEDVEIKKINYIKLLSENVTESEIDEIISLGYKKFEPLWNILPTLSENFKMIIVNNGPEKTIDSWDKYFGYSKYMAFVNSEREGIEKPDPRIYEIACNKIGLETNEVIYMDDCCGFPEETEKLNMRFIHWDSTESGFTKFKKVLEELNILID